MSDLIDYRDNWGGDGMLHATTDYSQDDGEYGQSWRWRHSKGNVCRVCGCIVQNGCHYCSEHAGIGRKVRAQVRRLLAYKARRDAAREDALRDFRMSAIVGRAVRRTNAAD